MKHGKMDYKKNPEDIGTKYVNNATIAHMLKYTNLKLRIGRPSI